MTATQLLEVLTSFSLQVLVVLVAGKILERVVRRSSDRCGVWNICFISILFLACAALLLPRLHLFQPWSRLTPHELLTVTAVQSVMGKFLLAVWSIGASVLMIRWMVGSYFLRRSLCRCEQLPKLQVELLLATNEIPVANHNIPILLISDESEGPYCWQLHRPAIVLPRFLFEGSQEDIRNVLIHEMEHLKTNHPFHLFMQQLAQIVCWFHPVVWSAAWRASLAREFCCDDAAAGQGANSAAYLRTLLHIAERCEQNKCGSAIGFGRTPSEIVLRAHRLVKLAKETKKALQPGFVSKNMATCALFVIVCGASQMWIPSDPMASSRAAYSPWPTWTAEVLHCFGCSLRDYEQFDRRAQLYELQLQATGASPTQNTSFVQDRSGG